MRDRMDEAGEEREKREEIALERKKKKEWKRRFK